MSACISPCCRRWPTRRRTACANSSSDYVSFSRCTTRNVLTRRSTTRRLPSATRFHRAALTASCARRNMEIRTYAGFATMERSNSTAGSSTSTRPWWVSRLAWLKLRTAVGPSATARSCSAPSPIGPMNCENQSARAVDLGTTLRVVPQAHSPSNNRPERNENCVTYVVGLKCYLCRRLLKGRSIAGYLGLWFISRGADMTASEVTSETNSSANRAGVYLAVLQLVFTLG